MDPALEEEIRRMMEQSKAHLEQQPETARGEEVQKAKQTEIGTSASTGPPRQAWSTLHESHVLTLTSERSQWYLRVGAWECEGCHQVHGLAAPSWHCADCQRDVCPGCLPATRRAGFAAAAAPPPPPHGPPAGRAAGGGGRLASSSSSDSGGSEGGGGGRGPPTARERGGRRRGGAAPAVGGAPSWGKAAGGMAAAGGTTIDRIGMMADEVQRSSQSKEEALKAKENAVKQTLIERQKAIQEEAKRLAKVQAKLQEIPKNKQEEINQLRSRLEQAERSLVLLESDAKKKKEKYLAAQTKLDAKLREKEKTQTELTNLIMAVEHYKERKLEELMAQMEMK